jgi:hypothetical protein
VFDKNSVAFAGNTDYSKQNKIEKWNKNEIEKVNRRKKPGKRERDRGGK